MAGSIRRTLPADVGLLRVDGVDLPCRIVGSGPPILCSELPLNPLARLSGLQERLAESYAVHLVDFRPLLGRPDAPPAGDLVAQLAEVSLRVLDALALDRVAVLGTFMYAGVAMQMAIAAPARVARLVLLGTLGTQRLPRTFWLRASTGLYRLPGFPAANRRRAVRWLLESIDHAVPGPLRMRELFADPAGAPISLEDLYEQNKTPERADAAFTLMWCIRRLRCDQVAARAHTVTRPALLLHGEDDLWVPVAEARTLASRLPDARLVVIPGARHAPELDRPEPTLAAVRTFLAADLPGASWP